MGLFDNLKKKNEAKQLGLTVEQYDQYVELKDRGITLEQYKRYAASFSARFTPDQFLDYLRLEKDGLTEQQITRYLTELSPKIKPENYAAFLEAEKLGLSPSEFITYTNTLKGKMTAAEYAGFLKAQKIGFTLGKYLQYLKSFKDEMTVEEYSVYLQAEPLGMDREHYSEYLREYKDKFSVERYLEFDKARSLGMTPEKQDRRLETSDSEASAETLSEKEPEKNKTPAKPQTVEKTEMSETQTEPLPVETPEKNETQTEPLAVEIPEKNETQTEPLPVEIPEKSETQTAGEEPDRKTGKDPSEGVLYRPGEEPAELKQWVDLLFSKFAVAFPDKQYRGLSSEHKGWGESAARFAKKLGYKSTEQFLAAYGYTPAGNPKGGRPRRNDTDVIVSELKERYRGRPLCRSFVELTEQNPDLASQLSSLRFRAQLHLGMTIGQYLIQEGIIDGKVHTRGNCEEAFELLRSRYAENPFTGTVTELKRDNGDVDWDAIAKYHSTSDSTDTFKEFLVKNGVIASRESAFEKKLTEITEELKKRYPEGKQFSGSVEKLKTDNPDLSMAGINEWTMTVHQIPAKEYLIRQGIMEKEKTDEELLSSVIKTLKERYSSGEKKAYTITELRAQDPDLPINTIGTWTKRLFGKTATEYLTEQGILTVFDYRDTAYTRIKQRRAEEQEREEVFTINNGVLKKYSGKSSTVVIPEGVTVIDRYAFFGCTSLKSVVIPDGVTEIGDYAFYGCTELSSVVIPESVTEIGESAFGGCTGLCSVVIPEGVTKIGGSAFDKCTGLCSVVIPEGVTVIYSYAFHGCTGLSSVVIPESVTKIGFHAFSGCEGLSSVVIPAGVTEIGENAFEGCTGLCSVVISEGVTVIAESAFEGCTGLTSVSIPASVTQIEKNPFAGCSSLKQITVDPGNPVYSIVGNGLIEKKPERDLYDCRATIKLGLRTGSIPEGVTEIGENAFSGCEWLSSITIPANIQRIGKSAFAGCTGLCSVVISEGVTVIDSYAFRGCTGLSSVVIPAGVTEIGYHAFYGCTSLKSVVIPESVTKIGIRAFSGCEGLSSVVIPAGVTEIGENAFEGCTGLCSVVISEGVTVIAENAFEGCTGLTSVSIPASVTQIEKNPFAGCSSLKQITVDPGNPVYSIVGNGLIEKKPKRNLYDCRATIRLGLRTCSIPEDVTEIGDDAFRGCTGLTSITIPANVQRIGKGAFAGCTNLKKVTFTGGISVIEYSAFQQCLDVTFDVQNLNVFAEVSSWGTPNRELFKEVLVQGEPLRKIVIDGSSKYDKEPVVFLKETFNVEVVLDDASCAAGDPISVDLTALAQPTDEQLAYLLVFQTGKKWESYLREAIKGENANAVFKKCAEVLRSLKRIKGAQAKAVADTAISFGGKLDGAVLRALSEALTALKQANEELNRLAAKATGATAAAADPAAEKLDRFADACDHGSEEYKTALSWVNSGIRMNSGKSTSRNLAVALTAEFIRSWNMCRTVVSGYMSSVEKLDFYRFSNIPKTAPAFHAFDGIVEELDHEAFFDFLKEKIQGAHYRPFLIPFCLYAAEKDVAWFVAEIRSEKKGSAKSRIMAESAETALLLSETKAAAIYLDSIGRFPNYAAFHGVDPEELRIKYLNEFDLDENGEKKYDLGSKSITLRLSPDLSLKLFDGEKEIKSIPKKDSDPKKYEAALKDFADMKTTLRKVAKNVCGHLRDQFYAGKSYKKEAWESQFLTNPVLRSIARLIVWKQGKKTFILSDKGPVDVNGAPYALTKENILLAHPMEQDKQEVAAWQDYLLSHGLVQPFDQIWEPVVDVGSLSPNVFNGCEIPLYRFHDQRGITFTKTSGYDYDAQKFGCTSVTITLAGCSFSWEPAADAFVDLTMQSMIRVNEFACRKTTRMTNHLVAYLTKCTIYGRILKDDETVADQLDLFTAAQIMDFIRVATENKCTKVCALLLDYKNARYAGIDPLAEFTLDL